MATPVKLKLIPAGTGDHKSFALYHNKTPLRQCYVYPKVGSNTLFDVRFHYFGHARDLVLGEKKQGMLLRKFNNDVMYLYVDGLSLEYPDFTKEQLAERRKNGVLVESCEAKFKTEYLVYDNLSQHFSGWAEFSHCRETAFDDAALHISERMQSGIPTKKPFIVYVKEQGIRKGRKIDKRIWEITTTIIRKK